MTEDIGIDENDKGDAITYYQSASYFYKSGMNPWTH